MSSPKDVLIISVNQFLKSHNPHTILHLHTSVLFNSLSFYLSLLSPNHHSEKKLKWDNDSRDLKSA
ncbi:hypothetical protein AXX17_AT5G27790 [Arabidopsis thaliana]|uniref:Uncharacterized protein n=1 Tax=Arabidopsis thaliana TaxID=3702 RepID=A0A178UA31_ARATH|nr:hypothetical protein AXX17_AT5G27790 [Arabidopsis thaliana]